MSAEPPPARTSSQVQPSAAQARMLARPPGQLFGLGALHAVPLLLVLVPFALLFGVVATDAGLGLAQVMGFSTLVLAGASQFTAVQLISEGTPAILVIVSSLAVNLRMAMYSVSLVPWLGRARLRDRVLVSYLLIDQTFALGTQFYEANPGLTIRQRLSYFFGVAAVLCGIWFAFTFVGATVGRAIPEDYPLDFAVPITFLAMIAPMLRSTAHRVAAGTAVIAALALAWMPSGLGLLIAGPLGMAAGAITEIRTERKAASR